MKIPYKKINRGGEFNVYDMWPNVLKVPRQEKLFNILNGNFKRKIASDILFLQKHFADYFPPTKIEEFDWWWGIVQEKIHGRPLFGYHGKKREEHVQVFLQHIEDVHQKTHHRPELLGLYDGLHDRQKSGNAIIENNTGRIYIVDICILNTRKRRPLGYFVGNIIVRLQKIVLKKFWHK